MAHRVQLGYEQDSNVAEAVDGAVRAQNLRLLYDLQVRRRSLSFSYRAGAQVYPDHAGENKLTHEISAAFSQPLNARVELGAQLWSRFKFFLESEQDLICGFLQPFLRYRMDAATWLELGIRQEALDYANSDYFDYAGPGFTLQLYRRIASGWTLSPLIAWQRNVFQRSSYAYAPNGSYLFLQPDRQEDGLMAAGLHSEWMWRSLLITCQYKFESNHSNSYGYDYRRHVLTALFVQGWREWFFRGYFSWQKKNYPHALRPFLPVQLDTEQRRTTSSLWMFPAICIDGSRWWGASPGIRTNRRGRISIIASVCCRRCWNGGSSGFVVAGPYGFASSGSSRTVNPEE
jgi:hypothetical protein